jgi:hypothetical protein
VELLLDLGLAAFFAPWRGGRRLIWGGLSGKFADELLDSLGGGCPAAGEFDSVEADAAVAVPEPAPDRRPVQAHLSGNSSEAEIAG